MRKKKPAPLNPIQIESPRGTDKIVHLILHGLLRFLKYSAVFLAGSIVTLVICVFALSLSYLRIIALHSGMPIPALIQTVIDGRHVALPQSDGRTNVLILGTDALANRDTESKNTDTIMLVSIDQTAAKLTTFSLPRDLWIASQSAKINSLYGLADGEAKIRSVVGEITGLPIHRVVVVDIATVGRLIDAFGGLDVTIARSFVDYKFPRTDVDVRVVHDPNKLYETVAFTEGVEHMSGARALIYIRSRHSLDPLEGTDDARVRRQQQVITALLAKLKDPLLLRDPEAIGRVLALYQADLANGLSLREAVSLAWSFAARHRLPTLVPHQLPIQGLDPNGVLLIPNNFPFGAWVYEPVDPTWKQTQTLIQTWLKE